MQKSKEKYSLCRTGNSLNAAFCILWELWYTFDTPDCGKREAAGL